MSDVDHDHGPAGPVADPARPDLEQVVAELRETVRRRQARLDETQARTQAVAAELAAAREGNRRAFGDELFEDRIARLARDVESIGDELVHTAEREARARRAAADDDAERTLAAARGEAQAMLDQALAAADQVRSEGGAQIAAIDADRQRLDDERDTVLGALASLHARLGDVAEAVPGGGE